MHLKQSTLFALVIFLLAIAGMMTADAWLHSAKSSAALQVGSPPVLPMRIYGKVQLERTVTNDDGDQHQIQYNVPVNTEVSAWISDTVYATTTTFIQGDTSVYIIDVPGDPPSQDNPTGGNKDATIRFVVMGLSAAQTVRWESGKHVELDLIVRAELPIDAKPITIPEPLTGILFASGLASLLLRLTYWKNR